MLPTDRQTRKETPLFAGVFDYFPKSLAAVAGVSFHGNKQHNPGEELHWAKHKSTDHADCILRHLMEIEEVDDDAMLHAAKVAWRGLALCEMVFEAKEAGLSLKAYIVKLKSDACSPMLSKEFDAVYDKLGETIDDMREKAGEIPPTASLDRRLGAIEKARRTPRFADDVDPTIADIPRKHAAKVEKAAQTGDVDVYYQGVKVQHIPQLSGMCKDPGAWEPVLACPKVYVAGPMTGYELFNFPAFDAAKKSLVAFGFQVTSPADIDRANGIDPADPTNAEKVAAFTQADWNKIIRRDVESIMSLNSERGDAICMLKGWEKSTGASAEFMLARWCGLRVIDEWGEDIDICCINWHHLVLSTIDYLKKVAE